MKAIWKFLISLGLGLCAVAAIMVANGTFQTVFELGEFVTDKQMQRVFKLVNDAFFIPALLWTGVGILVVLQKYLRRNGMFSFITNAIKKLVKKIQGDIMYGNNKIIKNYRNAIREKDTSVWFVLATGLVLAAATAVTYLIYLSYC